MTRGRTVDESLLDRFFERQRREIMARILEEPAPRRPVAAIGALAAAALLVVALTSALLVRGPARPEAIALDAFAVDLAPATLAGTDDPLAAFGAWPEETTADARGGFLDELALPAPFGIAPPLEGDSGFPFDFDLDPLAPTGTPAGAAEKG